MFRRPLHWFLYAGTWVLMSLYYTTWDMATTHMGFWSMLPMNLCQNAVWGLEGLLVLRMAERFPITSFGRRSLPAWIVNLGLGVVLAVVGLGIAWLISLGFADARVRLQALAWFPWSLERYLLTYLHSVLILMWAVLGAFHGFRIYHSMRERELEAVQLEASLAKARNRTLLAQFQPHFLFNALNSISSLIHTDPDGADAMVAKLGDLLRMALDAEADQRIPLSKELALVEAYLAIEKVRFQERLSVEIDVPRELGAALVPKFLLQPLVENAVKHGLAPRSRPGRLRLEARREGPWLCLEVRDDGVGCEGCREGVGLGNTRARLNLLYKDEQSLDIISLPDKGTRVLVRIPFR